MIGIIYCQMKILGLIVAMFFVSSGLVPGNYSIPVYLKLQIMPHIHLQLNIKAGGLSNLFLYILYH